MQISWRRVWKEGGGVEEGRKEGAGPKLAIPHGQCVSYGSS